MPTKKPTLKQQRIEAADGVFYDVHLTTLPAQAEAAKYLQVHFKLTREEIAETLGITLRQTQTRLKQYKLFVADGQIPTAELEPHILKAYKIVDNLADAVDEELEKEAQSEANREGNLELARRMIEDQIAEKLAPLMPSKHDMKRVEDLWKSARPKKTKRGDETAVAIKSDWHVGLENTEYDFEIAMKCNDTFMRKVIRLTDLHRSQCDVSKIVYILNGDNIQGSSANFPSQRWTVRETAADQCEMFVGAEIDNIELLLMEYDTVEIVAQRGNHGNIYPKKSSVEPAHSNFETMAHRALRWAFRDNKRVTFQMSDDWYDIVAINDFKLLVTHGHAIPGAGSMDGLRNRFRALADILPHFDAVTVGHFHQFNRITLPQSHGSNIPRTIYQNGTSIKGDDFSDQFGSSHSNLWWNLFVNENSVTAEYPVRLYD